MKIRKPTGFFILKKFKNKMENIKELIGKKVVSTFDINVENGEGVFSEILKEKKFKNSRDLVIKLEGKVTSVTSNSVEVYLNRIKESGVNCFQWFNIKDFERTFKVE